MAEEKTRKARNKAVIPVTGMTCAACISHVTEALEDTPGVSDAQVNLATGQASVGYDPEKVGIVASNIFKVDWRRRPSES
ncbi:heavy-metal-associated domain-containing protein [Chloroflexota bacterium]